MKIYWLIVVMLFVSACSNSGNEDATLDLPSAKVTKVSLVEIEGKRGHTLTATDTFSFQLRLVSKPNADVALKIRSSDTAQGIVRTKSLRFTPQNYNQLQIVTVQGVQKKRTSRTQDYNIILEPLESADELFENYDPEDIHMDGIHVNIEPITEQHVVSGISTYIPFKLDYNGNLNDLDLTLLEAPSGMEINSNSRLYWLPSNTDIDKEYVIKLHAQDGNLSSSITFKLFVNAPKVLTLSEKGDYFLLNDNQLKLKGIMLEKASSTLSTLYLAKDQKELPLSLNSTALSETFYLNITNNSIATTKVVLPELAYAPGQIKVYALSAGTVHTGAIWHESGENYEEVIIDGKKRVSVELQQRVRYKIVLQTGIDSDTSVTKAPSRQPTYSGIVCSVKPLGAYRCVKENNSAYVVTINDFNTTLLSKSVDVSYVANAVFLANDILFDLFSVRYSYETVTFFDSQKATLGFYDAQDPNTLFLSRRLIDTLEQLKITTAHEQFHMFQAKNYFYNTLASKKEKVMSDLHLKWLVEGTAAWFQDQGALDDLGDVDDYAGLQILKAGVNSSDPSLGYDSDPYARSLLWRFSQSQCNGGVIAWLPDLFGSVDDGTFGIKQLASKLASEDCMGDRGSALFLANYNFVTMYLNDVKIIDFNEPEPRMGGFEKSSYSFSNVNTSSKEGRYLLEDDAITVNAMGAVSFELPSFFHTTQKTGLLKISSSIPISLVFHYKTADGTENKTVLSVYTKTKNGHYLYEKRLDADTLEYFVSIANTNTNMNNYASIYAAVDITRNVDIMSNVIVTKVANASSTFATSVNNNYFYTYSSRWRTYDMDTDELNAIQSIGYKDIPFFMEYDENVGLFYRYAGGTPRLYAIGLPSNPTEQFFQLTTTGILPLSMGFSPTKEYIYLFHANREIHIYNTSGFLDENVAIQRVKTVNLDIYPGFVSFNNNRERIYIVSNGILNVLDVSDPLSPVVAYKETELSFNAIMTCTHDGNYGVTNSHNKAYLFDITEDEPAILASIPSSLSHPRFTKDDRLLYIGNDVYELESVINAKDDLLKQSLGLNKIMTFTNNQLGGIYDLLPNSNGRSVYISSSSSVVIDGSGTTRLTKVSIEN